MHLSSVNYTFSSVSSTSPHAALLPEFTKIWLVLVLPEKTKQNKTPTILWLYISSPLLPVSFNLFEKSHLSLLPLFPLISQPPTCLQAKTKLSLAMPSTLRFSATSLPNAETALLKMSSDFLITKSSGHFSVLISGVLLSILSFAYAEKELGQRQNEQISG